MVLRNLLSPDWYKCNDSCQILYRNMVFSFSIACLLIILCLTCLVLQKQSATDTTPALKRRYVSFITLIPLLFSLYLTVLYLKTQYIYLKLAFILEHGRDVLRIYAFFSFWKLTEKQISEEKVQDLLQRKAFATHFAPFRWCLRQFNFLTEEQYKQSKRRFHFWIAQAGYVQLVGILIRMFVELDSTVVKVIKYTDLPASRVTTVTLWVEFISLIVASYHILLYTRMLRQEYRPTNWGWKYSIFIILFIFGGFQWAFFKQAERTILPWVFNSDESSPDADVLTMTTNAILLGPETLLCMLISIFAFGPIPAVTEHKFKTVSRNDMSFSEGRAHHQSFDGFEQDMAEVELSFHKTK